ncbi:MAG: glycoside hydrolase family 16 protein [Clostridia bacterium]|nr:glycoside hydrolase family 16 protein [Clostridia bacterium]
MDLKGYTLVFEDNFDGKTLDLEKWQYRGSGARRCGFNAPSQVFLDRGNLILKYQYRTDGEFGEGWYAGMISARQRFTRGYFEIRCICNDPAGSDFWSAFWLQARAPYTAEISRGGIGGAEIDIIEAFRDRDRTPTYPGSPGVETNIHVTGMKNPPYEFAGHSTQHPYPIRTNIPDCFTEFHVYGCEWTDEVYRFYVDGRLVGETNWGDGVSEVDEELIISLELPGETAAAKERSGEMIVDYVRVYQKI